ncbi:MAG: glycosyltransferase family 2 protein [Planctomycetaceae bacterium]
MVSVVIPLLNENDSLRTLHDAIAGVLGDIGIGYEIIFVDDGSTDSSWATVCSLAASDPRTRGIRFRRNFGKAAALAAGFEAARHEIVITMDADLQDDPKEIPRFLEKMSQGLDVVSGWKRVRHDPWHKTIPSLVFNRMVSRLTGVRLHDHNCGFKSYRREIFDEVKLYGERHRFVPVLAAASGWKVGEIEVLHHARAHGVSKYGLSRLPKGFLDLLTICFLTGYAQRPLHLIGSVGLIAFVLGGGGLILLSILWVTTRLFGDDPLHLHRTAVFYYCITAILLGGQFLVAGLLAELMTSIGRRTMPAASIAETTPPTPDARHLEE